MQAARTILEALSAVTGAVAATLFLTLAGDSFEMVEPIAVAVGSAASYTLFRLGSFLPRHVRWIRRLVDPRSVFEGAWKQFFVGPLGAWQVTLVDIVYLPRTNSYAVHGRAVRGGVEVGSFNSKMVSFDSDYRTMSYMWQGEHSRQDLKVLLDEDEKALAGIEQLDDAYPAEGNALIRLLITSTVRNTSKQATGHITTTLSPGRRRVVFEWIRPKDDPRNSMEGTAGVAEWLWSELERYNSSALKGKTTSPPHPSALQSSLASPRHPSPETLAQRSSDVDRQA